MPNENQKIATRMNRIHLTKKMPSAESMIMINE